MGDDDSWPWHVPLRLLDQSRGLQMASPARLPMIRLGIAEIGNDEDIDVAGFHGRFESRVLRIAAFQDEVAMPTF